MGSINYVRSASGTAQPSVPPGTHTETVTAALSSNGVGDTLFVVGYGANSSIGSGNITSPSVTDTAGNSYTQIGFTSGTNTGSQTFVHALYWCPNCLASAGTNTITFSVSSANGNPIFSLAMNLAVSVVEFSGFTSPVIQDWDTQVIVGAASPSVSLSTTAGTVTSSFATSYTNSMFSVVDIYSAGADFLIASLSPSTSSPGNPTVTGASWTYTLEENAVFGVTNYWLSLWIRGTPVTTISQPQVFVVT